MRRLACGNDLATKRPIWRMAWDYVVLVTMLMALGFVALRLATIAGHIADVIWVALGGAVTLSP